MKCPVLTPMLLFGLLAVSTHAIASPLIVAEDRGGVTALPDDPAQAIQFGDDRARPPSRGGMPSPPSPPTRRFSEADMLPIRSTLLTPGMVERRAIQAPGLRPLFLIGDDEMSRAWLRHRADTLLTLGAIGLVVNVDSPAALADLRRLASGLILSPVSADDLARRLGIDHYPVLITATAIEQ